MSYIIRVDELQEMVNGNDDVVLVDVRFQLNDEEAGRKQYIKSHIPGAVYLDLNRDLASKVKKHGGNHPLPDLDEFVAKLGNIGIDNNTTVVVYDKENDMFAARLWWLLHYVGHEKVYVLEGGFNQWVEAGNEVTNEITPLQKKTFRPKVRTDLTVTMEEVKDKIYNRQAVVIDSRSKDRYLGIHEPMYRKAGHIPGAVNFFWKDIFTDKGTWKSVEELKRHFATIPKNEEIIVSCGSGVSACPNIIALKQAGYENVKLYPGSFSDWISYDENDIELDENILS